MNFIYISAEDELIFSRAEPEDDISSGSPAEQEEDHLLIDEEVGSTTSEGCSSSQNAKSDTEEKSIDATVDPTKLSDEKVNGVDTSVLTENLVKSDILQTMVTEALKKIISENPILAKLDPSQLLQHIDQSTIAKSISSSADYSSSSNNKKQIYERPPDLPTYNPTPISVLEKRKSQNAEIEDDSKISEGEFSSDEELKIKEENADNEVPTSHVMPGQVVRKPWVPSAKTSSAKKTSAESVENKVDETLDATKSTDIPDKSQTIQSDSITKDVSDSGNAVESNLVIGSDKAVENTDNVEENKNSDKDTGKDRQSDEGSDVSRRKRDTSGNSSKRKRSRSSSREYQKKKRRREKSRHKSKRKRRRNSYDSEDSLGELDDESEKPKEQSGNESQQSEQRDDSYSSRKRHKKSKHRKKSSKRKRHRRRRRHSSSSSYDTDDYSRSKQIPVDLGIVKQEEEFIDLTIVKDEHEEEIKKEKTVSSEAKLKTVIDDPKQPSRKNSSEENYSSGADTPDIEDDNEEEVKHSKSKDFVNLENTNSGGNRKDKQSGTKEKPQPQFKDKNKRNKDYEIPIKEESTGSYTENKETVTTVISTSDSLSHEIDNSSSQIKTVQTIIIEEQLSSETNKNNSKSSVKKEFVSSHQTTSERSRSTKGSSSNHSSRSKHTENSQDKSKHSNSNQSSEKSHDKSKHSNSSQSSKHPKDSRSSRHHSSSSSKDSSNSKSSYNSPRSSNVSRSSSHKDSSHSSRKPDSSDKVSNSRSSSDSKNIKSNCTSSKSSNSSAFDKLSSSSRSKDKISSKATDKSNLTSDKPSTKHSHRSESSSSRDKLGKEKRDSKYSSSERKSSNSSILSKSNEYIKDSKMNEIDNELDSLVADINAAEDSDDDTFDRMEDNADLGENIEEPKPTSEDELEQIFNDTIIMPTQIYPTAFEKTKVGVEAYIKKPIDRIAREGAKGNLLRGPSKGKLFGSAIKTPTQTMMDRYAKMQVDTNTLQKHLKERAVKLLKESKNPLPERSFNAAPDPNVIPVIPLGKKLGDNRSRIGAISSSLLTVKHPSRSAGSALNKQITPSTSGGKDNKRIAHVPAVRPTIIREVGAKVPHTVRQKYLDSFVDEALKFITNATVAYKVALSEEKVCYSNAGDKQLYYMAAVGTKKRLRSKQMSDQVMEMLEPDELELSLHMTTSVSTTVTTTVKSAPPLAESNAPLRVNSTSRVQSHYSSLAAGGVKGSWSVEKPKKVNYEEIFQKIVGVKFYEHVRKYLLTEQQLIDNCYPRGHPNVKGKAIAKVDTRKKISPSEFTRFCARCHTKYTVDKWGFPEVIL